MQKVLFFMPSSVGGAERMTVTIAKQLDRKLFDVHFVIVGKNMGEITEFIPETYPVSLVKVRNIYDFSIIRIFNLMRKMKPQIAFCSLMYLNPRIIIAAKIVGCCKTIVRFNCAVNRVQGLLKSITKKTYLKADVILAQTDKMKEEMEEAFHLPEGKVITLHNLIDKDYIADQLRTADNPYNTDNKGPIFVWVGRFNEIKRLDVLIKSFSLVVEHEPDARLFLVGKIDDNNSYYKQMVNLIAQLNLQQRVSFAGFQTNPYKWMKYADCFVLTSRSEASPNVMFESLYIGTPVVVSDCTPNLTDIITESNGFVVPIEDVERTAEAMLKAVRLTCIKCTRESSDAKQINELFSMSLVSLKKC